MSMRRLIFLPISLTLTLGAALAYEPDPPVNVSSMTSEYNKGHYAAAQHIGAKLLVTQPSDLAVHYLLGNCYVKFSQLDKAVAEYKFCAHTGSGSQLGTYAKTALDQIAALQCPPQDASMQAAGAQTAGTTALFAPLEPSGPPLDKFDVEMLEYKERMLKTGADLIAANRIKLQRQIEAVQEHANGAVQDMDGQIPSGVNRMTAMAGLGQAREKLLNDAAARIQRMQDDNDAEEQRITAYYQAQVDRIASQKPNLSSQAQVGKGDMRLRQKGTGLFVRNYVNFHGEVPLPPPPPELKATAQKLNPDPPGKQKPSHD